MKKYFLNDREMDLDDLLSILLNELETEVEELESFQEETYIINGKLYSVGVTCGRL